MDVTLELVEQLRKRADVSYEEARAVLEETGGDLLAALILLEQRGKIRSDGGQSARYSTRPGSGQAAPPPNEGPARPETAAGQSGWETFVSFLRRCVTNRFEVWRWEEPIVSIPLLIFILLVLLAFWISVPLLIIGLIMGCRYRLPPTPSATRWGGPRPRLNRPPAASNPKSEVNGYGGAHPAGRG